MRRTDRWLPCASRNIMRRATGSRIGCGFLLVICSSPFGLIGSKARLRRSCQIRPTSRIANRSEEHTSELQSRFDLVCRLLLEKKKTNQRKTCTLIVWRSVEFLGAVGGRNLVSLLLK